MRLPLPRSTAGRAALLVPLFAVTVLLLVWRGPDLDTVVHAFDFVRWRWVVAALGLNLVSVVVRAVAWRTVIRQALPGRAGPFGRIFSAFAIGLLGNAVLPGRIGELARVAVLTRRLPRGQGYTATLVGTVFAHRLFDLIPALLLVAYVLVTARIPQWAVTSLLLVSAIGLTLFLFAIVSARRAGRPALGAAGGGVRRLLAMGRQGLGVLQAPVAATAAALLQCVGWFVQLLAVWVAMRAFGIDAPLPAAGLVLLLMNVATIFPLWPGNIGLLQAAVALPLVSYGVAYATGFAYGLGLQVIEMSVGVGVGLLFLMREGLSFATLKGMPGAAGDDGEPAEPRPSREPEPDARRASARVPG